MRTKLRKQGIILHNFNIKTKERALEVAKELLEKTNTEEIIIFRNNKRYMVYYFKFEIKQR